MATHIALLRGINVGGYKKVDMKKLKVMFEELSYENVRTYINSGNVVFEAEGKSSILEKQIKTEIQKIFGFEVEVMVRTAAEMRAVIDENPFKTTVLNETIKLYVSFLLEEPSNEQSGQLEKFSTKAEMFKVINKEVYILTKLNLARESLLGKGIIDKQLKTISTNRNWRTVNKLVELVTK